MLTIKTFIFNPWQENTYVIHDETKECVIIDAGCFNPQEEKELKNYIVDNNLTPKYLLNTHLHIDHIMGNAFINKQFGLKPYAHENDEFLIDETLGYAKQLGLQLTEAPPPIEKYIDEKQAIKFGNTLLEIFHIPGHTPGHVVYYNREANVIFSGDVLFYESIGRTDMIYGNYETLVRGIHQKLLTLPNNTRVLSGHGDPTTIKHEATHNPFIRHMNIN